MKTSELLEQDKERFLARLAQAETPDQAVLEMEEEMNRLFYRCQEEGAPARQTDAARSAALVSFDVAKSALALADGAGEVRLVPPAAGVRESRLLAARGKARISLLTGISLTAVSALFLMTFSKNDALSFLLLPALLALAAGGFFLVRSGMQLAAVPAGSGGAGLSGLPGRSGLLGRLGLRVPAFFLPDRQDGSSPQAPAEPCDPYSGLRAEVRPDPEKLYRHMKNILLVIDRNLEEQASLPAGSSGNPAPSPGTSGAPVSSVPGLAEEDLVLFSELLEQAYALKAQEDSPCAREIISGIRYHLHQHGVELADSDGSHPEWFDRIPSAKAQTLRPALIRRPDGQEAGVLVCRGLCT